MCLFCLFFFFFFFKQKTAYEMRISDWSSDVCSSDLVVILDRVLDAIEAAHGPLGALRLPQVKFLRPLLPRQAAWVEIEAVAPSRPDAPASRWRFRVEHDGQLLASVEVAA